MLTRGKRTEALLLAAALLLVFICSSAVLLRTQLVAPHIYGIEGYHHMAVARMIRTGGIPHDFPWMRYTVFDTGYADLHLLHHLALAPFAGSDDPDILEKRAKTATAFFGAALLTLFFFVLRRFRCPGAIFWTAALVCGAGGFFFRLAQPRPELLSLFLLLLAVPLFARRRRRYWPHLLLGLFYTLTGPSPYIVVATAVLFLIGRRLAGERPLDWRMPLYTLAGTAAGFLAHPDRWDFTRLVARINWRTLLTGLVSGSGVPQQVQAAESKSPGLDDLLLHNELVVLPLAVLLLALLLRRRKSPSITGETVALFLCSLAAFGLTITAARHTLYWAAFTTLFSAFLLRDLLAVSSGPLTRSRWQRVAAPTLILLALIGIRTHDFVIDGLLADGARTVRPEMRDICAILDAEAEAGDVVFHSRWIHYPQLLFHAPQQHYLVGLDPMLMLAHGEQYLEIWQDLRMGKVTDPYPFIRGLFESRHLLISRKHEWFLRRLDRDPRFLKRFNGRSLALFTLRDFDPGFITSWQVAPLSHGPRDDQEPLFLLPDKDLPRSPYHQMAPPGGIPVGFVDFRPFFPLGRMAPPAALAETVIELDQAAAGAEIRFGSSGPCQLELNGETLLLNRDANHLALIDHWHYPADLRAGENSLRVIAARTPRDWGFFLRVVDSAGRPLAIGRP